MRFHTRLVTLCAALGLIATAAAPAQAVSTRQWPVTPAALGLLYGSADPGGLASVRVWGPAAWCYIQPTPDADVAANLERLVAPELDAVLRAGGTATMTIGHPAPWLFDNHPAAVRTTPTWSCGDHAAGRAIPSSASLRPARNGTQSVQAARFRDYVGRVVDYLAARYQGRLPIVLQVWNEPNIPAGLDPKLGIPGSARTAKDAAKSLHALDTIAYEVIRSKGARSWLTLASCPLLLTSNTFGRAYLAAHNRQRRVDAVHLNVYSYDPRSLDRAVIKWDKRAAMAAKMVRKYRKLRTLPLHFAEVNVNLINRYSTVNVRESFSNAAAQRRLATATQMNAYYRGVSGVHWLVPWRPEQAAVHVHPSPGNPARDALVTLQSTLVGKRFIKCKQSKGVRTCTFRGPGKATTLVLWRNSKTSTVRSPKGGQLVEMTGATRSVAKRERLRVGTTPIVIR